jgi:hypothetical protein
MLIKVKYTNNRFDLIKGEMLEDFLAEGRIRQFYRYSEDRWITVGADPIRTTEMIYPGPERRAAQRQARQN